MFHMFEKIRGGGVYFIAEMSANHGGSLDTALDIIQKAADAGADCVKIQTYTADTLTIDCDNQYFHINGNLWDGYTLYDLYKEASTPYEWHKPIKDACEKCGIDFLSTPFDTTAVDFLENLGVEAYKIASFELIDVGLIEYAASKGKPMLLSCGMASPEEIRDALDACKRAGNDQIVLLKCCSEYPANCEDMHLGNIPDMRERFQVPVGFSDHSLGSIADVIAVALGAQVIEKHIKIAGVESADSAFSMSTDEYAQMVRDAKMARRIAAGPDYSLTAQEQASTVFRRSLFAVQDIMAGDEITTANVRSIRPGYGVAPKYIKEMLGKRAAMSVRRGEPISAAFLESLK